MSTNGPQNQDNQEIDLFTLFTKVGDFFQWINRMLFLAIHFFVKNIIVVIVLILLGFGVGLYLDKTKQLYDHQIIVAPNFKSTDYLYAKIDLLATKIAEKDSVFFKGMGIYNYQNLLRIKIEPVVDIYKLISSNEQNFELLALLAQNGDLKSVVKETTTSKNYNFHTIIVSTNGKTSQKQLIDPLLVYLNTTAYYKDIQKIAIGNIQEKIKVKENIIVQIDEIINSYSTNKAVVSKNDKMIYYNDNNQLDNIIKTKDTLASTMAALKIELFNSKKIINDSSTVLNVKNDKFTNGKFKFLLPLLFIGLFIVLRLFLSFYKSQSAKYA
ncbi:hypothetical protein [Flavobacterium sp.]|uniref:hypothetical protein n=1 Tax=Flavobacterium sp. TaxID=239 RepID=UPI002639DC98|nr:hypothetical protein [Flavobacterium sp.]MDG2433126.1 hypothetical protein [Flavobacterium sp.]